MKEGMWSVALIAAALPLCAGELRKDYFGATTPGAWAEYRLESSDGTKSTSTSRRMADEDGHVVVEEGVKIEAGPGAGADVKNTFVLPKGFNLARDWLSHGKFTEKMTMKYGSVEMPVDATTLEAIRKGTKDYRGAVTFEGVETVQGRPCDRYAYSVVIAGPAPGRETGQLWLSDSVAFGIVRQLARSFNPDGSAGASFDIQLQNSGAVQAEAPPAVSTPVEMAPAAPSVVSLPEGYQAGRIGISVAVEKGSSGRRLRLTFKNKTEAEVTVKLAEGELSLPAGDPIGALRIHVGRAASVVVPAGGTSDAVTVGQQPGRGALEGTFELSVYEGTPLYSGSVTRGTVPK